MTQKGTSDTSMRIGTFCDVLKPKKTMMGISMSVRSKRPQVSHTCEFVKPEQTNMITNYFQLEKTKIENFRIEDLFTKIAMLTGQMNLPLSFSESPEFYDFVTYCMAFGASVLEKEGDDLQTQAKTVFPHHKRTFYHDLFVKTASSVHLTTMEEFKKLDYVCCAIDQGMVF